MRRIVLTLAFLASLTATAPAVQPDEVLHDAALEARARQLSRELRCMVCQNQSIDDSDAPLARDLRILVRDRLKAGDNDTQVIDFLVARYGEFVLLKPRFEWHTAILWLAPPALLILGAIASIMLLRRGGGQSPSGSTADLTVAEKKRVDELLKADRG